MFLLSKLPYQLRTFNFEAHRFLRHIEIVRNMERLIADRQKMGNKWNAEQKPLFVILKTDHVLHTVAAIRKNKYWIEEMLAWLHVIQANSSNRIAIHLILPGTVYSTFEAHCQVDVIRWWRPHECPVIQFRETLNYHVKRQLLPRTFWMSHVYS